MSEKTEQAPRLVKPDGERTTPSEAAITRSDMIEIVKAIVGGQQAVAEAQDAKQEALVDALQHIRADINKGEYNIANFPNKSVFNPEGELHAPRPAIVGEVSWVGTPCIGLELTRQEIELLNQIQPGKYHHEQWVVRDLQPDIRGVRKLRVDFPNKETDQRAELPGGYWDPREKRQVTGMEQMLREMVEEAAQRQPVSA